MTGGYRSLAFGLALAMLVGCGAGGIGGGIGSGGTGASASAVSVGAISGFGSVIVNGVRYDDSAAAITKNSDGTFARDALRLGMQVEVNGSIDSTGLAGSADAIRVRSELAGPVGSVGSGTITVLGALVRISASTVYEGGVAANVGDQVEVYGSWDSSTESISATRIEIAAASGYRRRGRVSGLDVANRRFSLGGFLVDYSALGATPAGLLNGADVRILATTAPAAGQWPASALQVVSAPAIGAVERVEIEGYVSAYTALSDFVVDGIPVDGASASFSAGTAASLRVGKRVEVKGSVQAGRLLASRISFEDDSGGASGTEFEIKGSISAFSSLADFVVRNTRVDASGPGVSFEGGSAGNVTLGRCVEIKGMLENRSAGSVVRASKVAIESDCH